MVKWQVSPGSQELVIGVLLADQTTLRLKILIFDMTDESASSDEPDDFKPVPPFRVHAYIDRAEVFRLRAKTMTTAKKTALRYMKRVLSTLLAELAQA